MKMSSIVFYYSLRFLSGPIFIQDTGSRWTVGIIENESSLDLRRSELSRMHLSPRIDACIRNAGETSNARRRRTLQGELPGPGWLVNKPPWFGLAWYRVSRNSICLTHMWENAHITRTHVIMLECVRLSVHMIYVYANIFYQDAPASIVRRSIAVNVRIVSNCVEYRTRNQYYDMYIYIYIPFYFND